LPISFFLAEKPKVVETKPSPPSEAVAPYKKRKIHEE
jgi:hypothetical protein